MNQQNEMEPQRGPNLMTREGRIAFIQWLLDNEIGELVRRFMTDEELVHYIHNAVPRLVQHELARDLLALRRAVREYVAWAEGDGRKEDGVELFRRLRALAGEEQP